TLDLFHYLARQTRRLPLVLLGTFTSDDLSADQPLAQAIAALRREQLVEQVLLEPLGREATERLVTSLLQGKPSEPLTDWLFATTGGNPLFVEQLVLALSSNGQLELSSNRCHATTDLRQTPKLVGKLIARSLQRLSPSCQQTLALAAILGVRFDDSFLLAALSPVDEVSVQQDLNEAVSAQVLRRAPRGFAFRHV